MNRLLLAMMGALLWLVVGCASPTVDPSAESEAPQGGLVVEGARAHLLPGGHGAVYLQISNGGAADRLLSVETPLAAVAELHESLEDGGVMRMVAHPEGFPVPAEGRLQLEPGGKHVMLMQIQPTTAPTVPLTLRFEKAGTVEAQAQVLGIPGDTDAAAGHIMMDHDAMDHDAIDHSTMDHDGTDDGSDGASSTEAVH